LNFLGIDVGTTNVKALVVDGRGKTVARASEPLAMRVPQPGWAEQSPADWWKAALRAIKRAVARRKIDAIGLSGQMHSSVFLDSANKVIRPTLL
jgi:xylulokinase